VLILDMSKFRMTNYTISDLRLNFCNCKTSHIVGLNNGFATSITARDVGPKWLT